MRIDGGSKPRELEERPTKYHRGGEAVSVRLVVPDTAVNYYAGMFVMAVSTWGGPYDSGVDKWNSAPIPSRMATVRAILQRQALPLALEHPQFLFEVTGCSRSAFDQIARLRIGTTFSSMGTRDNALPEHSFSSVTTQRACAEFELIHSGVTWAAIQARMKAKPDAPVRIGWSELSAVAMAKGDQAGLRAIRERLEGEAAQKLVSVIPCAEKVPFLKTGGEEGGGGHQTAILAAIAVSVTSLPS